MIFKLAHLIHLDLDHQNVFRQFHILFYQNQINSSIRLSGIRLSGIRLSGIRLSGTRLSGIRLPVSVYPVSVYPVSVYPVSVYPVSVYPVSVYPVSVYPVSVYPVSVYPVSGTRLFYHAGKKGMIYYKEIGKKPRKGGSKAYLGRVVSVHGKF